jgi:competence protein ComEC
MPKSWWFIIFSLAVCAGIWFGSYREISNFALWLSTAGMVALAAFIYKQKLLLAIPFVAIAFIIGMWRIQMTFVDNEFTDRLGTKVEFEGFIMEDPDRRLDKQLITIRPKDGKQNVLITTSIYVNFAYGDWVLVRGKLTEPKQFDDFDYRKYLERFNIYAIMYYPKVIVLKNQQGHFAKSWLLVIKHRFAKQLEKVIDEPRLSLLLGILIGARKTLPQEITDAFAITGLSHIVAVSGYNISILIAALERSSKVLGRRLSFILSCLVILGFVIISGASSSVIRASLMGGLLLVSFAAGRLYVITPALCAAALVMLLINPKILYWDVGFQLSFAATMGIVYILPVLESMLEKIPNFLSLKSYVLSTFAAIIATLPLVIFQFHRLSVVAPLANVLVLPVVPLTMLTGFLSAIPFFGGGFAFLANYLLAFILAVTKLLSAWSYASLEVVTSVFSTVLLMAIIILFTVIARIYFRENIENLEVTSQSWYNSDTINKIQT